MIAPTRVKWLGLAIAALPYPFIAAGAGRPAPQTQRSFSQDVQPIFKAHCFSCHSGSGAQGGLRLDTAEGALKVVVKGDADKSSLLRRIKGLDGLPQMPMGFRPLSDADTAIIAQWIAQGARIDGAKRRHWAYIAPTLPKIPSVKLKGWVRNPIDNFVLARLEKEGLRPSPEASRETLIRRLSLDITGLPPTPQQTDAFLKDKSPNAYEKAVDRLLASPHYGERMAQKWLDLARYADSDGFEKDLTRTAYKYRDWTIDAFNRNEPFDKFTIEQIAGDELPNATVDQLIATGFCRNAMTNREDGVDQAEAHLNVEVDRVSTVATTFLGSTLACARCHDHKYDPFTQKDFYRMTAFFSNDLYTPKGNPVFSNVKWEEPEIKVPTKEQAARLSAINRKIAALPKVSDAALPTTVWSGAIPTHAEAENAKLQIDEIGTVVASGPNAPTELYKIDLPAPSEASTGFRIETIAGRNPGNLNFVITNLRVLADGKEVPLLGASADFSQQGFDGSRALNGDMDNGWAVDPKGHEYHNLVASFVQPVRAHKLEVWISTRSKYVGHNLGAFRLSLTSSSEPHAEHGKSLAAAQRDALLAEKAQLESTMPSALVLKERDSYAIPQEWLRTRGEFMSKAELLTAGTPASLPPLPKGVRPSRLALAQWLVAKNNPLTARVEANRLWETFFGAGLVETSEDFGTQGTPRSHPELLDWLAVRLRDGGWNVKDTIRLIVNSATYRQSSVATPALLRRDPNNRLLARGSRFRLEAETIRDNALAVAGLLSPKIGGPSVMPDQPDGVWDIPYGGERWMRSEGENRWRRGLYTMWKRSAPYPAFIAFDATSRESCTVRRIRTNTPLQALALLNDTGMLAAAEALAGRMTKEGGKDPLRYGFRLSTGRLPNPRELQRLKVLKDGLLARYRKSPSEAAKFGGVDKAALTLTANVLLNLDETITRE
jgi:mono/diheme cytochrome c family protein